MLSVAKADGTAAADAKGDAKLDKAKPWLAVGIGHGFSEGLYNTKIPFKSHETPMKIRDFIGMFMGFSWIFVGYNTKIH